MTTSLDILLSRFRGNITELGFEVSERGFNELRKTALDYQRKIRSGEQLDGSSKKAYDLYRNMISIEGDTDFLENRYPEY